jgi:hypothetical protein
MAPLWNHEMKFYIKKWYLLDSSAYSLNLKMEAGSAETSVNYQTTELHFPEDSPCLTVQIFLPIVYFSGTGSNGSLKGYPFFWTHGE